jgi:hypothetical protein
VTKILALAGKKSSGKTTLAQFLAANRHELFGPGTEVKVYGFADPLKEFLRDVFGLTHEQLWGTEEEKNSKTSILWESMPGYEAHCIRALNNTPENHEFIYPRGPMTAREVMQVFGTQVVRRMDPDAWVRALLAKVAREAPDLAVVADTRFENEARGIQKVGGKVVRLLRRVGRDAHASETALDAYPDFDLTLDNREAPLHETRRALVEALRLWGWAQDHGPVS